MEELKPAIEKLFAQYGYGELVPKLVELFEYRNNRPTPNGELEEKLSALLLQHDNTLCGAQVTIKRIIALIQTPDSNLWVRVEALISLTEALERDGAFLDNPHDHPTDRAGGKAYKDCAERLRLVICPLPQPPEQEK